MRPILEVVAANPLLQCHRILLQHRFSSTQSQNVRAFLPRLAPSDSQVLHCLRKGKLQDARNLLDRMPQSGQYGRVGHWTSLLSRISRQGFVDEAICLFDIMPEKNVVTYNAMLSAFVQSWRIGEAETFFEQMPERNVVSWTSMLCGFANEGRIREAGRLFDEMPEKNIVSWNAMISGLVRNGNLEEARRVFDMMPVKDSVTWNSMIAGYVENDRAEDARVLFEEMENQRNVVTWTSMVSGYCRIGVVQEAYSLFEAMPDRNVVSWTAMISGFAWNGWYKEALLLFLQMSENADIKPNEETFISLAYACAGVGYLLLGKQLHTQLIVNGWESNDFDGRLAKSLIHMYTLFTKMDFAEYILLRNVVCCNYVQSWNSVINGYIKTGELKRAQNLFEMAPVRDTISWTCMISGHLNEGDLSKAYDLFNNMPEKDSVAWTVMISGHVDNELFYEAVCLFTEMRAHGIEPLDSTLSVLLGGAGAMASLDQGRQFHGLLLRYNFETDLILQNALISMYAKCGKIDDAYMIFSDMGYRDCISWNSVIAGFAIHGMVNESLQGFAAMLRSGSWPNSVTFLGILTVCSHVRLLKQGWQFFDCMSRVFGVIPGPEHYICMIDMLGRAGKVDEAEDFVLRLPFEPDRAVWGALLGVCGLKNNFDVGGRAAKHVLELDSLNGPAHVVLCNMYAANGRQCDEKMLRKEMGVKGVKKTPGCSWILVKGRYHMFLSGDNILPPNAEELLQVINYEITNIDNVHTLRNYNLAYNNYN